MCDAKEQLIGCGRCEGSTSVPDRAAPELCKCDRVDEMVTYVNTWEGEDTNQTVGEGF